MKNILSLFLLLLSFTCFAKGTNDSIIKTYTLKGGYKVVIKRSGDSNWVMLEHGKNSAVLNSAETSLGVEALGYVTADFDSAYIMTTHVDANPVTFEIIDKERAATVMYGKSPFYRDTIKNIMMFEGMYGKGRGKLILYTFKNELAEYFTAPLDTPCFCCSCWKLVSLTDREVKIQYENLKHEKVVKVYPRK